MKKLLATLALGLGLVFASGVAMADDAPAKPAAEATAIAPAAPAAAQASASDDALMSMLAPRYEDQEDMLLRSQRTMALA